MADLDAEQRARVEDVLELVTQIASGDFGARREISPRRDEIDALVIALNLVAEDFGIERARRHKAEEELRDRIEAYESAPAMFCSVDAASGRIVDCNRTMEAALGRPRAALVGSGLESLYVPEAAEHARASLRALRQGEPLPPGDHTTSVPATTGTCPPCSAAARSGTRAVRRSACVSSTATSRPSAGSRGSSCKRRRWRRSGAWRAASRTTSTTS